MTSDKEMPDYEKNPENLDSIPLSELLKNSDKVFSKVLDAEFDPLLITQNNKPTCALVSLYDLPLITGAVNNPLLEASRFEEPSASVIFPHTPLLMRLRQTSSQDLHTNQGTSQTYASAPTVHVSKTQKRYFPTWVSLYTRGYYG